MAETHASLQQIHQRNHPLGSFFASLDPMSLILSQNSDPDRPIPLQLTTDCYIMERGPRYRAYAELRESKLRRKNARQEATDHESRLTPPKKQVKFQGNSNATGRRALRKENRKPANPLPAVLEMTPPATKSSKMYSVVAKLGGSKSASAGEKKGGGGGLMARKSYANVEELKGFSSAAANAINGENRGGRTNRGIGKTVLGSRQY
ncbi:hypothetical protein PVL29_018735 [Vitis rotundifolia]|uniref:Uncharacterized protein n=1 Tax=Vitis rotundifolia TaxID=103349 RepID=A0AA38Z5P1_VITRO|nr:hypothetical protein PVL29_018735 [Vitis rotundifolia]